MLFASIAPSAIFGATAKVTTSAPEDLRNERRESCVFMAAPSGHRLGRALHCAHDARMRAAAAKIRRQGFLDLRFARPLVGFEERRRLHDHAVDAVAALH